MGTERGPCRRKAREGGGETGSGVPPALPWGEQTQPGGRATGCREGSAEGHVPPHTVFLKGTWPPPSQAPQSAEGPFQLQSLAAYVEFKPALLRLP